MKYVLSILFSISVLLGSDYQLINEYQLKGDFHETDHLGNIYIVEGARINKYDNKAKLLATYNNNYAFDIAYINVDNPMKIFVFYKDFAQIEYLSMDLTLAAEPIELGKFSYPIVDLACPSYNNGIWIWDPISFSLIRFDKDINETNKIESLQNIVGQYIEPDYMVEHNNKLYINDLNTGIFVFDIYGTYLKKYPFPNVKEFNVAENKLFMRFEKEFILFDMISLNQASFELPASIISSFSVFEEKLFIFDGEKMKIFAEKL